MTPAMRRGALASTIVLGVLTLWIAKAFILPILFGAIIASVLVGPFEKLKRKKVPQGLAALILTLGSVVLVFLPLTFLAISGARSGIDRLKQLKEAANVESVQDQGWADAIVQVPVVDRLVERIARVLRMDVHEVVMNAEQMVQKAGLWLADFLRQVLASIPEATVLFFLTLLAIYFVLVDGHRLGRFFRENSVFPPAETNEIVGSFNELCRSVLLAQLVAGLAQSAVYFIGLLIAGSDGIPLITFLVFVASFIPLFGAGPVTIGFALYRLFAGEGPTEGIILLVFAVLTGMVDNFVKPAVLQGSAKIHPLISLIALFGGLETLGFTGVFLGPIAAGMFLVTLNCFLRTAQRTKE